MALSFATTIVCISLLLSLTELGLLQRVAALGINYGQVADNLPLPSKVLNLLASLRITKTRIYDTNPQVLTAFANSGMEIIVNVPNNQVSAIVDPQQALQWVNINVRPYFPSTKISGIAVGNEVFSTDDATLMSNLVPAMTSIQNSLAQLGLDPYIHVSTANSLAVLESSFPPSSGVFRENLSSIIKPFLKFLASTRAPFWINAYPFFAYKSDPTSIPLDYVLFNPNSGMADPQTKLHYDNMLYAQVDAVIFAMSKMGFEGLDVRVSETGWPSKGDPDEVGATIENAEVYNRNLMHRQEVNEGTPLRPNQRLEVYLFALFNEDMKPGPTSERNYGLYQPDGTSVYNVGFTQFSPTPGAIATVSLTSSANMTPPTKEHGSMCCWILLFVLTLLQALITRKL